MNNEVRERLRNLTRRLADVSFAKACDDSSTGEEFQNALDALADHLKEVRKRSLQVSLERELA